MFQKNNASSGTGILRSETHLTAKHSPEEPVSREAEIQRIAEAVRPVTHRETPENLLIHGPAGTGKTACVKHVLDNLETQTRVEPVYINAWKYNTRPSLLTELLIQLGYPAPRKGKPVDELLSKLREWLDKNHGVVVAIDEFDQLAEKTEVIYDLQMLNKEAENPVGIIMVSNQLPSKLQIDPRSRSRLNCQTLPFDSYNASQLQKILEKRVEQAFKPGSVPDEVLKAIAEKVAENSGDCREALEKLLRAGRRADQEGRSTVNTNTI